MGACDMGFKTPVLRMVKYPDPILGGYAYKLIHLETLESIPFYTEFLSNRKILGSAPNSIDAYAYDLSVFFNYLTTSSEIVVELVEGISSPLVKVVSVYPEFLLIGVRSSSDLVKEVSWRLGWEPVGSSSQKRMLSTVNEFIKSSASYQRAQLELNELGLIDTNISTEIFARELLSKRNISSLERRSLLHNSFLAGVVSGGPSLINSTFFRFKRSKQVNDIDSMKAFPIERSIDMLNNARSARDQALWALLMGTGIRISEAYTILMEDVLPLDEKVNVIDPNTRINRFPLKKGHSSRLDHKGRQTKETFFIEPFRSIFFKSLRQYLDYERPSTLHSVLFVKLEKNVLGEPCYFKCNSNTYNKAFKRAAQKAGVTGYTAHSLRHMYGFFVVNFLPTSYGAGLPLEVVQVMMGHASLKTTSHYAKIDKEKVRGQLESFNKLVAGEGLRIDDAISNDLQLDHIHAALTRLSSVRQ